jgi:hypothetical protein
LPTSILISRSGAARAARGPPAETFGIEVEPLRRLVEPGYVVIGAEQLDAIWSLIVHPDETSSSCQLFRVIARLGVAKLAEFEQKRTRLAVLINFHLRPSSKVQGVPIVVEGFFERIPDNGFDFLTSRPEP